MPPYNVVVVLIIAIDFDYNPLRKRHVLKTI
jgi:hypothetical protein